MSNRLVFISCSYSYSQKPPEHQPTRNPTSLPENPAYPTTRLPESKTDAERGTSRHTRIERASERATKSERQKVEAEADLETEGVTEDREPRTEEERKPIASTWRARNRESERRELARSMWLQERVGTGLLLLARVHVRRRARVQVQVQVVRACVRKRVCEGRSLLSA